MQAADKKHAANKECEQFGELLSSDQFAPQQNTERF